MWFASLILISVFFYGSFSEDIDCSHNIFQTCVPGDRPPISFPETKENLIKMCTTGIEIMECILNHANACGLDNIQEMEGYKLNMLKFICDRDLPVFHALAQNLKCLKTVVEEYDQQKCYKLAMSAAEKLPKDDFQNIYNLYTIKNDTEEENTLRLCYNIAFENACAVAHISQHCDPEAKETAQRVLSDSDMLQSLCKPKAYIVVNEFAKILDMEADKM